MPSEQKYTSQRDKKNLKANLDSIVDWLRTLDLKVVVETLNESNLLRRVQLMNIINQMNLSTRRLSVSELLDWLYREDRKLWTFCVSDKFGDSGLTGIISVEVEQDKAKIIDFI
jgi:FkbH-like protein